MEESMAFTENKQLRNSDVVNVFSGYFFLCYLGSAFLKKLLVALIFFIFLVLFKTKIKLANCKMGEVCIFNFLKKGRRQEKTWKKIWQQKVD